MSRPRALCLVPHFLGEAPQGFTGGSTERQSGSRRARIVKACMKATKRLSSVLDLDIAVCGMAGHNVLPLDIDFTGRIESPGHILWQIFREAPRLSEGYDWLMVVEDDIITPVATVRRMMDARSEIADPRQIIFPNRVEYWNGLPIVVDLFAMPGWTGASLEWRGQTWREAQNHNSAFLMLDRAQRELLSAVDFSEARLSGKGGYLMAGAYHLAHSPFTLLREQRWLPRHYVVHHDSWLKRQKPAFKEVLHLHLRGYTSAEEFAASEAARRA